jgi:hypothetical protein
MGSLFFFTRMDGLFSFTAWRTGKLHICVRYRRFAAVGGTVNRVPDTTQPRTFLRVLKLRFSTFPQKKYHVPSFITLEPMNIGICLTCGTRKSCRNIREPAPATILHVR